MSGPERIWAKTHGASTDVISGQVGLIGGWNEHRRDGQEEYLRRDIADTLRGYCQHDDDCTINRYSDAGACSCGLSAALAKMGE